MFGEWVQAVGVKASGAIFVDGIQHINLTRPTQKKSLGQKLVDYSPLHIFKGRINSLYNFRSPDNVHKIQAIQYGVYIWTSMTRSYT